MNPLKVFFRSRPLSVIFWKFKCKLFRLQIPKVDQWLECCKGKIGLEIGGPSGIFNSSNYLPIYSVAKTIDGVNFSSDNLWSKSLIGNRYVYEGGSGRQFVLDGIDLNLIENNQYDFILSSNNLEHIANPIKALKEWKRVLKNDGTVIMVLPRKESNFDHKRPVTTVEHIKEDYQNEIEEDDLTHLEEILRLHNLKRDPMAGNFELFRKRSIDNKTYRALHHHVFDLDLLIRLLAEIGMKAILTHTTPTDHIIAGKKLHE